MAFTLLPIHPDVYSLTTEAKQGVLCLDSPVVHRITTCLFFFYILVMHKNWYMDDSQTTDVTICHFALYGNSRLQSKAQV